MSYTTKTQCPKCKSDDCNLTRGESLTLISASVATLTTYCNHCTYLKVSLLVNSKVLVIETAETGDSDTELEYMYLGSTPG